MRQAELCCDPGNVEPVHGPRLGLPSARGILGVEPGLDGMTACVGRFGGQSLAVGDGKLQLHQVQARGQFGDGVFDLKPGVHFEKIEFAGPVR